MLQKAMKKLAAEKIAPRAGEIDEREEFPRDIFEILLEHEVLALPFPEEYGGVGVDLFTYCLVVEELSKVGLTALPFLTSHSGALDCFMEGGAPTKRRSISQGSWPVSSLPLSLQNLVRVLMWHLCRLGLSCRAISTF